MPSEQHIPGILGTAMEQHVENSIEAPAEEGEHWTSRYHRGIWGIGVATVAIVVGVTVRSLLRKK